MELSEILSLYQPVLPFFEEKWIIAAENERMLKGDHFTSAQKEKMRGQRRQSYSMASIATKLNIISATQRQSRTDWEVLASNDPNDEWKAEAASLILHDIARRQKFKHIESEIFDAGSRVSCGAVMPYVDYSNIRPEIKFRKIDYRNLIWDINGVEYEYDDAGWICELEPFYRFELEKEMGKKLNPNIYMPFGRLNGLFYQNGTMPEFDLFTKAHHYQKEKRKKYYLLFPDTAKMYGGMIVKAYDKKEKAAYNLRVLNAPYVSNGLDMEGSVEAKEETYIKETVFVGEEIIKEENYDEYPIKIYRAFHYGNDYWTFSDLLKSPQNYIDRLFAQVDYSLGTNIKDAYQLNVNALAEPAETAKEKLQNQGGVIFTKSNEDVVKPITSQGVNPQWLQIIGIMQNMLDDYGGGRSFQGLTESANESGKAIGFKLQQGSLVTYLPIDNLKRWKASVGSYVLSLVKKYDTIEHQIKLLGEDLDPRILQELQKKDLLEKSNIRDDYYLTVNPGGINYLADADFELNISETYLTDNQKQQRSAGLREFGRNIPALAVLPAYIKLLIDSEPSISQKDKKQLLLELENMNTQKQDMEQQKLNIDKANVLTKTKG